MLTLCTGVEYLDLSYCNISDNGLVRYQSNILELYYCRPNCLFYTSFSACVDFVVCKLYVMEKGGKLKSKVKV